MPPLDRPTKDYWRSLEELADSPEFRAYLEAEFPAEAADPSPVSRRRWLQLMGASLALAGLAGCRWEKQEILPYAKRPGTQSPGKRQQFATAMEIGGNPLGLLVTAFEGRPLKIEGNPRHPMSLGATDVYAQAAVLELYDPDRARYVFNRAKSADQPQEWSDFIAFAREHFGRLEKTGGKGFCVLSEASSSPTVARLREQLKKKYPDSQWYEYEPLSWDNARAGAKLAFGRPLRALVDLKKARVIVALDADPLGDDPAALRHARDFAAGRDPEKEMNRLYVVEPGLSVTGTMADHRLPLPPSEVAALAAALLAGLENRGDGGSERPFAERKATLLHALADDLQANRGRSVVVAGPRQPAEVHALVHRINALLDNVGPEKPVRYVEAPDGDRPSHAEVIARLAVNVQAGAVETLVILGGNPVYDAPANLTGSVTSTDLTRSVRSTDLTRSVRSTEGADLDLAKVPTTIHLSHYRNETTRACAWQLPRAHFLEAWGDVRAADGTYSIVQPLIEPLNNGKSVVELLAILTGQDSAKPYDLVRETFRSLAGDGWEKHWGRVLHDGLWQQELKHVDAKPAAGEIKIAEPAGKLEAVFCRDASLYDGRFANSGWLQELPDPITKLTWDNAALLSPATAQSIGVVTGDVVRVTLAGRSIELPAYVQPGQAPGCVLLPLGYGRTAAGHVGGDAEAGIAPVGVSAYLLRATAAMDIVPGATVDRTGQKVRLAMTQDHHAIDAQGMKGREERLGALIREASLDEYKKHPDFAKHVVHHPALESPWKEHEYDGYRWGMTIDLNKCIGCSACVVACQAENNIPVVGKDRVLEGREMHWIRLDRYYRGEPELPEVVHQPVACHHCENAPCEQVCPVAATVHSGEGLNDMVYNRCVGTRYCANNCPYKVRRFNFFNYHKELGAPENEVLKMLYNPEVTVRSRGVMEKCTYCVQRIQGAKIAARNARGQVRDGEVVTACQQVCPAQAIAFGDLNDAKSQVAQSAASDRSYQMLAELNVKPRTSYLARIRNPNPRLAAEGHS